MGYIKLTGSIVQIVSTTTPYSAMVLQLTLVVLWLWPPMGN